MPSLGVVFDTNVYRSLGDDAFRTLRNREVQHGAVGYASYAVVCELLAHLSDPLSPDFGSADRSLRRLWEHCSEYDGSQYVLRFVAGALEQICYTLFGTKSGSDEPWAYGYLVGSLVHEATALERHRPSLEEIAQTLQQARQRYVETLWQNVVLTLAPGATNWNQLSGDTEQKRDILNRIRIGNDIPLIASTIAREAARAASRSLDTQEITKLAEEVVRYYPTPVHYRSLTVTRLIESGPDMAKRARANGVIDLHLCCSTTSEASVGGVPLVLVTDDRQIIAAAERASTRQKILSLTEYRALLSLDYNDLVNRFT